MKHDVRITGILLAMFLLSQFIGLGVLYQYIDPVASLEEGKTTFKALPIGERPPIAEETSYIPIILAVLVGTGILLLLIKFKLFAVWKLWFLVAIVVALTTAFASAMPLWLAAALGILLGGWKVFKPNLWIQNGTELFMYGGLAAIFVPVLNLWSICILLILISVYDAYAVWKSKHMITLAKSQTKANIFAGLSIPYSLPKKVSSKVASKVALKVKKAAKVVKVRTALLGGGDIGFPLLFAGVILKEMGVWQSLVIPFFALAGLGFLFWYGKEKKFYPAMPFIGIGCFLGLGVVWLLQMLV